MTYREALRWLDGLARFGVRLGLERVERARTRLGRPDRHFHTVHLAGTNGKGSTAAMIAACLHAGGHRTGLFTSPHLCRFTERIQVGGAEISPAAASRLASRVRGLELDLTFFEAVTLMALCHFAEEGVDVAVIETGLGGRLDATNVIQPAVSVLTRIDIDHADILGGDLLSIAREKAGIIKRGVPVVSASAGAAVEELLRERCAGLDAPLLMAGQHFTAQPDSEARFCFRSERWSLSGIELALKGRHQQENAALCLAALELLSQVSALTIGEEQIRLGLREVRWPGRLERIDGYLLDGAHNPNACRALARALGPPGRDGGYCLVIGVLGSRPLDQMIDLLRPHCGRICLTRPRSPRAADPTRFRTPGAEVTGGLGEALALVDGDRRPTLITGSLYLVGEARSLLLDEPSDPWPTADPIGAGAAVAAGGNAKSASD